MNFIDMFVAVLLIYAVFRGYTKGFVLQLASLAALIAGIYAAIKFSGYTAEYLGSHWNVNREYLHIISLAITFVLVFIAVSMIGKAVDKVVDTVQLSFLNKIAGVVFNVCKIMLIAGILLLFIDRVDKQVSILPKNAREGSFFYGPVTSFTLLLFPSLDVDRNSTEHKDEEFV